MVMTCQPNLRVLNRIGGQAAARYKRRKRRVGDAAE